jgi:hypothetical protein
MSGRRRQQSKSDNDQPRTSAGQGQSAVKPNEEVSAGPSVSAKAPATRKDSRRRKFIATGAASAVISGFAGGAPPVAINAMENALHAPATSSRADISGGGYYFSEEWQGSSSAAIGMASQVVDIALRKARCRNCDAASKRRYIQWILAGNMTPAEAAQVLAQRVFQLRIKPLRELIQLIREEQGSPHPAATAIRAATAAAAAAYLVKTHREMKRHL